MLEVLIAILISMGAIGTKQSTQLSEQDAIRIAQANGVDTAIWEMNEGN